ncbi:hypothetical protein [Algoriphagus mannitolivorans]|uniref:hypothetical protein n=1 Tax=Algoriphagus mannitolivorans TaxID=226504 RepID=UPI00047B6598|nr:hypothetical protein [Algoriphagus mannitolivorans]
MIKSLKTYGLVILLLCSCRLEAQVVNIKLEIPAGVIMDSPSYEPLIGGSWEKNKAKAWISISTRENLNFLLKVEEPQRKIEPPFEAYFLNNGTSDFEKSQLLSTGIQELQILNQRMLIKNLDPTPMYLRAWVGIPIISGIKLIIEYP